MTARNPEAPGRVTLNMIASEAGVSVSTVSKVLNNRSDVSTDTKERVEGVMDHLGYQRRPTRRRGAVIDLVLNELDSLWSVEIIRGVDEVLHEAGASMVLSPVHGRSTDTREWIDQLAARRSNGAILVVSELTPQQRRRLTALDVPFVLLDPVGNVDALVPTVGATNWAGAVSATEHLVALGHTRIAHLAGPRQVLCSRARADGFRATMEQAGLPVPSGWVSHGEFNDTSGKAETARLLDAVEASGQEPPTAVFAASDLQALGAFELLRDRGYSIPDDMSIVGFDDLPAARWTHPPLTTVRQPLLDMASMAANALLRIIDGEQADHLRLELATQLTVRGSTAPRGGAPPDTAEPSARFHQGRSLALRPGGGRGGVHTADSAGLRVLDGRRRELTGRHHGGELGSVHRPARTPEAPQILGARLVRRPVPLAPHDDAPPVGCDGDDIRTEVADTPVPLAQRRDRRLESIGTEGAEVRGRARQHSGEPVLCGGEGGRAGHRPPDGPRRRSPPS